MYETLKTGEKFSVSNFRIKINNLVILFILKNTGNKALLNFLETTLQVQVTKQNLPSKLLIFSLDQSMHQTVSLGYKRRNIIGYRS